VFPTWYGHWPSFMCGLVKCKGYVMLNKELQGDYE